jgi:uncharacterized protein YbbK (DUF523 family)
MNLNRKIVLGISACTYGCKYRYNGKGWDLVTAIGRDRELFTFQPVCPEIAAGLGVPRPAIRIQGESGHSVWAGNAKVVSSNGLDITERLKVSSLSAIEQLKKAGCRGMIYMEGSPSCGVLRTTLKNKRLGKPPGVFGALLLQENFFLIPAHVLQSPIQWWDYKRRLLAFEQLYTLEVNTMDELFHFWHSYKFLCQELKESRARAIGTELAALKTFDPLYWTQLKAEVLELLKTPSTLAKIKQKLWKQYSFYRKKGVLELPEIQEPTELSSATLLAKELTLLEKELYLKGELFGAVPVFNRQNR